MSHPLLKYVEGDMFGPIKAMAGQTVLVPHVCNDRGAWGSGFVVPLGRNFPKTRDHYLKWHGKSPPPDATYPGGIDFGLGKTQVLQVSEDPRIIVFNMVAQVMGVGRPLFYNMLARCMDQVAEEHRKWPNAVIHCPMFGSSLAGGDWNIIEQLVYDCWLRTSKIPTTVYYLPGTLPDNWRPPTEQPS
jgi:hypothetical protein